MLPSLSLYTLRSFLQENWKTQLQSEKETHAKNFRISNGMIRTAEIVAELYQGEVLTEKERDDIQHLLSTPVRANEQLLSIMQSKNSEACDCFLEALINTDQKHIAKIWKCEDEYLDINHSLVIQRNYKALIDNLDVGGLLDRLYQDGLLSNRELETITSKPIKHEKCEKLLSLVSKFIPDNYKKFVQALKESHQEHVVSILTGKDYSKSESTTSISITVGSKLQLQEKLQRNPELQQDSNQILRCDKQKNIFYSARGTKASSCHVKRKSILTFESHFTLLPDEFQTELALKVITLRQKTVLTNVDICYLKLLQVTFRKQTGQEENIKQTKFEDTSEIHWRVNEPAANIQHQVPDDLKTGLSFEEIRRHRNNDNHLDEALKTEVTDLSNDRQKSLRFETQLDETREPLGANRERFVDLSQERATLPEKYKLDPVLVQTIRTNAAEDGKKLIKGMTILDKELYVVSEGCSEIEVYDSMNFNFSRQCNLTDLIDPKDLGSCHKNKCLYLSDKKGKGQSSKILRVDSNGNLINSWSTGKHYGRLSVTDELNVILAVFDTSKLNEYSPNGQLIRKINLLSIAGIHHPLHAIKLTNGDFVVSHGFHSNDQHRVCVVDGDGKLKKSFGEICGSGIRQTDLPIYLAVDESRFVMVADRWNTRVLLLDSDLELKKEILSREKYKIRHLSRIHLDQINGLLFVADNEWDDHSILIFKVY